LFLEALLELGPRWGLNGASCVVAEGLRARSHATGGVVGVVGLAVGGVASLLLDVVFFQGRPGRRAAGGGVVGGCGGGGGGGGGGGRAAASMASSTRDRHLGMFLAPSWRPLGLSTLMS
jgi:hypothetical protein